MSAGARVNEQDNAGRTPLFYVILENFFNKGKVDIATVELLLASGADPNLHDNYGVTSFEYAHARRDKELMNVLQQFGADKRPLSSSYLSGKWRGVYDNGYTLLWGLNVSGKFSAYAKKADDLIWYGGTWSRRGDFLVFNVTSAGSIEDGSYYIIDHPFSMKLRIVNLKDDEITYELISNRKRFVMTFDIYYENPDQQLDRREGVAESRLPRKAATDIKRELVSQATQDKTVDWSLDYPKKPLQNGERFPVPKRWEE